MSSTVLISDSASDRMIGATADLRLTRRLLTYLAAHRRLFVLALLLYPVTAAAVVIPPYVVRHILDVVIPQRQGDQLVMLVALYLGALLLEYLTGFVSQLAMSVLGQRAMRTMRAELFGHVLRLPASFFDRNPIGRVLTRLTNDVEAIGEVFATGAVTVIGDVVSICAVVTMMLWLDVRLTLFAFLVVPPLVVLTLVFRVYARRAFRDIRRHLARINTFMTEHLVNMAVVQLFRQEARTYREFERLNRDYRDANHSAILFDAMLFSVVEAIGTAAVAAMIWYGAIDLTTGVVGAGTLVAFIQYIRRFFIPIRDLSMKYTVLQAAFAAAERIFHLQDEPLVIASKPGARAVKGLSGCLELRDVWFAYREHEGEPDWVLKGMDLSVCRGEKVALIGATGSGKTTVLKLLNRSYDVQRGAVLVDGVDVKALDLASVRGLFAVVLQDVYLFSGTVMDNLTFAGEVSREQVRRACEAVQASTFCERLPLGYDTQVKEMGVNFSAGEQQLLAFARALARDPDVLVLDEATSSVDSETEARIQRALELLFEGRTAIVVAHRLSTVRRMDRIIVLHGGRVAEQGDHDSLMARDGIYSQLVELQFQHAEDERASPAARQ